MPYVYLEGDMWYVRHRMRGIGRSRSQAAGSLAGRSSISESYRDCVVMCFSVNIFRSNSDAGGLRT